MQINKRKGKIKTRKSVPETVRGDLIRSTERPEAPLSLVDAQAQSTAPSGDPVEPSDIVGRRPMWMDVGEGNF